MKGEVLIEVNENVMDSGSIPGSVVCCHESKRWNRGLPILVMGKREIEREVNSRKGGRERKRRT